MSMPLPEHRQNSNSNLESILNPQKPILVNNEAKIGEEETNGGMDVATSPKTTAKAVLAAKKRTKVSRACDSCRRKKIKCDAQLDSVSNEVTTVCSSCSKIGETCTFTRVPLKRGPIKGYNKRKGSDTSQTSEQVVVVVPPQMKLLQQPKHLQQFPQPHQGNTANTATTTTLLANAPMPSQFSQQIILPPLNNLQNQPNSLLKIENGTGDISSRQRSTSTNSQSEAPFFPTQQNLFWKAPSDGPMFGNNIPNRRLSDESNSSYTLGPRKRSQSSKHSSVYQSSDYSDSDDEFFSQNSKRMNPSRPFQMPIDQQQLTAVTVNRTFSNSTTASSPRASIQRPFTNSLGSINRGFAGLNMSFSNSGSTRNSLSNNLPNIGEKRWQELWNNITGMMDMYYSKFHLQFPIMASKDLILNECYTMDHEEHLCVLELLSASLNILLNASSDVNIIEQINRSFEIILSFYLNKTFIETNESAKSILTTCLTILNYSVILSGYRYSLGFGIAFSYFRDWLIFKSNVNDLNFNNLINNVLLDNIYSLYYGTPRASTICFSIDIQFANNYFANSILTNLKDVNTDFMKLAMHLLIYGNDLQELDSIDKLFEMDIKGLDFKFMQVLKINNDLIYFCKGLNEEMIQLREVNKELTVDHILTMELNIAKMIKRIINIIDEQLDDFEILVIQPMLPLIVVKCAKILKNLNTFVKSILSLNQALGIDNDKTKFENDPNSEKDKITADSLNPSIRFKKFESSISNNMRRCYNVKQPNDLVKKELKVIIDAQNIDLIVKRVTVGGMSIKSDNSNVLKDVVFLNWIRMANDFWNLEITREGLNGWCSV